MLRTSEAPPSVSYYSAASRRRSPSVSATGPHHEVFADAKAHELPCRSRTFPHPRGRRRFQKTLQANSTRQSLAGDHSWGGGSRARLPSIAVQPGYLATISTLAETFSHSSVSIPFLPSPA